MEKTIKKRFVEVDSLRGLAALMVAVFHFDIYNSLTDSNIVSHSWLFVDFFFVLSGFIISYNYKNYFRGKDKFKRFIFLRAGRLFPLHLSMLFLFLIMEIAFYYFKKTGFLGDYTPFSEGKIILGLFFELGMMHALPFSIDTSWNSPSWSVSVEFYVYLIFSFSVIFFGARLRPYVKFFLLFFSFYLLFKSDLGIDSSHEYALPRCIYGFFLGVFVERLYIFMAKKEAYFNRFFVTAMEVVFFVGLLIYLNFASTKNIQLLAPLVFALFIIPFLFGLGGVSRFFRLSFFQLLGRLSYSIYMVHAFIFLVVNFSFKVFLKDYYEREGNLYIFNYFDVDYYNVAIGNIVLLFSLFFVLLMSVAAYYLIEKPSRLYVRQMVEKRYSSGEMEEKNAS